MLGKSAEQACLCVALYLKLKGINYKRISSGLFLSFFQTGERFGQVWNDKKNKRRKKNGCDFSSVVVSVTVFEISHNCEFCMLHFTRNCTDVGYELVLKYPGVCLAVGPKVHGWNESYKLWVVVWSWIAQVLVLNWSWTILVWVSNLEWYGYGSVIGLGLYNWGSCVSLEFIT